MFKSAATVLFTATFISILGGTAQAGHTDKDRIHCQAYHPTCGYENAPPENRPFPSPPKSNPDTPGLGNDLDNSISVPKFDGRKPSNLDRPEMACTNGGPQNCTKIPSSDRNSPIR